MEFYELELCEEIPKALQSISKEKEHREKDGEDQGGSSAPRVFLIFLK